MSCQAGHGALKQGYSLLLQLQLARQGYPYPIHHRTGCSADRVTLLHGNLHFCYVHVLWPVGPVRNRCDVGPKKVPLIAMVLVPRIITEKS